MEQDFCIILVQLVCSKQRKQNTDWTLSKRRGVFTVATQTKRRRREDVRTIKTSVNVTWRRRKHRRKKTENFLFLEHTLRFCLPLLYTFRSVNVGDTNADTSPKTNFACVACITCVAGVDVPALATVVVFESLFAHASMTKTTVWSLIKITAKDLRLTIYTFTSIYHHGNNNVYTCITQPWRIIIRIRIRITIMSLIMQD